eukprot:scaffold93778_cov40-Cyclotella_meneghiniana.AAC.1
MKLESKDWRLQRFDETSQVVHVNGRHGVYVCTRSKPGCGACCYAVCQDCYIRAFGGETSRNKRIRNVVVSPNAEKHNRCRHELHNLEFESDLWWCDPKEERGLFTWDWMYKVKRCVGCNRMFVLGVNEDWKFRPQPAHIRQLFHYLANGYLEDGRVQLTADNEIVIDKVTNNVNKAIKNE